MKMIMATTLWMVEWSIGWGTTLGAGERIKDVRAERWHRKELNLLAFISNI